MVTKNMAEDKKEIEKPTKMEMGVIIVFVIMGFIAGFLIATIMSNNYISKESAEDLAYNSFNQGYNECRDAWINSLIGLKTDCYYETNEENTMVRYVCGNLTNGWRKI